MELVKKIINLLVENRIDFIVKNHDADNYFYPNSIEISFDFRRDYIIETLLIYKEDSAEVIEIHNEDTGLKSICSFEELSKFTPFKVI